VSEGTSPTKEDDIRVGRNNVGFLEARPDEGVRLKRKKRDGLSRPAAFDRHDVHEGPRDSPE